MENKPTTKRYPPELKERAVRMVLETFKEGGERHGVIGRIARQLGIGDQSLRTWVAQSEIDAGKRSGLTTEERAELTRLRRENRSLREDVEILKRATAFFVKETR